MVTEESVSVLYLEYLICVDMVHPNYAKAFDNVDHGVLSQKIIYIIINCWIL